MSGHAVLAGEFAAKRCAQALQLGGSTSKPHQAQMKRQTLRCAPSRQQRPNPATNRVLQKLRLVRLVRLLERHPLRKMQPRLRRRWFPMVVVAATPLSEAGA